MFRFGPAGLALAGSLLFACTTAPSPDTRARDEAAIRTADSSFSKAAEAKNLDQTVGYYADDATLLPPNAPMLTSHDAIHKMFGDMMGSPGFAIAWQATKADVARSGDLGYTIGTYTMTLNGTTDHGKYATVWRKQADGSWKVVADMFNSDAPTAAAPPTKPVP
jgi:ketosteroid isomerase-like protein